jgi:hypothetical protein
MAWVNSSRFLTKLVSCTVRLEREFGKNAIKEVEELNELLKFLLKLEIFV